MRVLFDSDILIEVSRARDAAVLAKWNDLTRSDEVILCSPVSVAELWHRARPAEFAGVDNLLNALICVPIDQAIGHRAGDFLRQYSKSHSLQMSDALIAATATIHDAALWTRNRKHYPMRSLRFY